MLKVVSFKLLCRSVNIAKLDADPKGAVIFLRNNSLLNGVGLLQMISSQGSFAKIRSNQNVVFIRNWSDTKKRLNGISILLNQLVKLLENWRF